MSFFGLKFFFWNFWKKFFSFFFIFFEFSWKIKLEQSKPQKNECFRIICCNDTSGDSSRHNPDATKPCQSAERQHQHSAWPNWLLTIHTTAGSLQSVSGNLENFSIVAAVAGIDGRYDFQQFFHGAHPAREKHGQRPEGC